MLWSLETGSWIPVEDVWIPLEVVWIPLEDVCLEIKGEDCMDCLVRGRHEAKTRE